MSAISYKDVPYWVEGDKGSKIGIIVVQEWWGLNQHIKNMTGRFAKALGALAITPDLYRGKVATEADEANHLLTNLDWPGAVQDIAHACEYLKEQGCTKIGITGFCMGGALVIASCVKVPAINAGSCFYGIPPNNYFPHAEIKCPIQFHFGDKDKSPGFSDIAAADALRDTLKATGRFTVTDTRHEDGSFAPVEGSGLVAEFHRYKNGDHAFMNEVVYSLF